VNTDYHSLLYLWEKRSLFIGSIEHALDISTGSATLMLALDNPIRFMTNEMPAPLECRSLLLPAGTSVIIDSQGATIANCTLDPLGADLNTLSNIMHMQVGQAYYHLKDEQEHIDKLLAIRASPLDAHQNLSSLVQILTFKDDSVPFQEHSNHVLDERVIRIIEIIQQTVNENLALSDLAETVNISPSRLTQLFKQQTGLPLRRYRLWHRLYLTTFKIGQGMSLTDAAAEAGFTDSPHFIRTFRSMLGMAPSDIFSSSQHLQIILPNATTSQSVSLIADSFSHYSKNNKRAVNTPSIV
jgi:AraC-like DNA-binding protein